MYDGIWDAICFKYFKHLSSVHRIKGFFEVYESANTFKFLVFDPLNLLRARMWDAVERSARNPFWSMWGRHRFSINRLNILAAIDVRLYLYSWMLCWGHLFGGLVLYHQTTDWPFTWFSPLSRVPLQISSSMSLNLPVFHTYAGISFRPAAFPFDIFWSTFWSSSFVKAPVSIGKVVWTMSSVSSSGLLAIGGIPRSAEK